MLEKAQIERAVTALVNARRRHAPLTAFPPNAIPKSLDDAYAVQEAFARRWSSPVAGYKVGCASSKSQRMVGASGPFAARVYAEDCVAAPATVRARDFFMVGVEAEFAFRLAKDFAPGGPPAAPMPRTPSPRSCARSRFATRGWPIGRRPASIP